MRRKILASLILFFLHASIFTTTLARGEPINLNTPTRKNSYDHKEILVKFKPNVSEEKEDRIKRDFGVAKKAEIKSAEGSNEIELLRIRTKHSVTKVAKELQTQRAVEFAEPNYFRPPSIIPNDTYYNLQWAHSKINSPSAWDVTTGKSDVTVAVIDTGVDYNHPDLAGKVIKGPDYFNDDTDPMDDSGHGTHVAGIAAAVSNNGRGVAGVSWGSKILAIKALGWIGGYDFDIAQGIIYAADNGAKIINLSLGGPDYSQTLKNAVDYAYSKGAVIVAATGNNDSSVLYPAAYPNVIGVGATNENDVRTSPSDWGPGYGSNYGPEVDVVAPGNKIASTYLGNTYAYMSGTSMATPHVAGLAALILARNPSTNPSQVEEQIKNSAKDLGDSGRDDYYGFGRIDALKTLRAGTERVYGQTSAGTAAAISQAGWANAKIVILARDDYFSDALAAVPLAYTYRNDPSVAIPVPILLTSPNSLDPETLNELKRLGTQIAIVVGGPGAISEGVSNQLRSNGITPDRIWQNSSYGTAADVAKRMDYNSKQWHTFSAPDTAIITTGENYPDAIAVSSPAAANNMPILLTKQDFLASETVSAISDLRISRAIIVGGPAAVSESVYSQLQSLGVSVLVRLWGNTQYDTAVQIATAGQNYFHFTNPGSIFVARGDYFTDGLSGGALASRMNPAPVILTESVNLTSITQSYLNTNNPAITKAYILGGPGAISTNVESQIKNSL